MNAGQPRFAPGDPVLVTGIVRFGADDEENQVEFPDARPCADGLHLWVPRADVHPVPHTPDPRDTALAAVRALCDQWDNDGEWGPGDPVARVRAALDGVVPVPAPPAPTPTGWTAKRDGMYIVATNPGDPGATTHEVPDSWGSDHLQPHVPAHAAILALRAEEAAAAAPVQAHPAPVVSEVAVLAARRAASAEGIGDPFMARVADHPTADALREADRVAEQGNVLAWRRVLEAAAAAPATTDDERLEAMCHAAYGSAWFEMAPESRSERRAGMHRALLVSRDDAHRAAESPS